MCYKSSDDVLQDNEIQSWIREINVSGFPNLPEDRRRGLPRELTSIPELADLVTKVTNHFNTSIHLYGQDHRLSCTISHTWDYFIYLFIYCHLYSAFSIVQCSNALYRL